MCKNGAKNRLIIFMAWLVYTINMHSNNKYLMKNYEKIYNCLRVIQQIRTESKKNDICY